jgi:hypothetical protein
MTAPAPILKSRTIPVVFAEYVTTGRHSSVGSAPIHEIIVIRERLREQREDLTVIDSWGNAETQIQERALSDEHARLTLNYDAKDVRPFYTGVYGQAGNNRLEQVARRIHELFLAGMKPSKLLEVGRPDAQFLDAVIPAESIIDNLAQAPAAPAAPAGPAPTPQSSAEYKLPESPASSEKPLNGQLVDHLLALGWEPQAAKAVARLHGDADGQPIMDEKLREVRGITNAAALKRVREHLASFA